jgi:hypothetical protein
MNNSDPVFLNEAVERTLKNLEQMKKIEKALAGGFDYLYECRRALHAIKTYAGDPDLRGEYALAVIQDLERKISPLFEEGANE